MAKVTKDDKMEKELELLLSEKEVKVLDRVVVVKRYSMLDTIRLASQAGKIAATVLNNSEMITNALNRIVYTDDEDKDSENSIRFIGIMQLLEALGDDGVDFIKSLISKATDMTNNEIEEIDLSDGVDLLTVIYEVNKGFFLKSMKKLQEKLPKIEKSEEQTS